MCIHTLRARNGASFLDAEVPGWADHIDLETLDIGSTTTCALAQLFQHYARGAEILGIPLGLDESDGAKDVVHLGFTLFVRVSEQKFDTLTAAWKVEVMQRRQYALPLAA
ncbi:MAG: hypothetical protein JWL88_767 [Parcubacteria group bacterium]|nr:hypothetical protein [Parcubacteria group bacterium]